MTNLVTLIKHLAKLIVVIAMLLLASEVKAQQGGAVTYGYDANGRLSSVTLPTGEVVTYSYDPAGNITAIQRVAGQGPQFLSFGPQSGLAGDIITFTGANFGSITSVSFNGTNATVFSGTMTQITATVPSGATSGQITVTLSNGTFTTSTFSVVALQITPSQGSVLPGQTQQFSAVVPSQLGNTSVTWSVNGINGGNSTVGIISSTGLYAAPNITTSQTFTIKATSVVRPTAFAQATIKVGQDFYQIRTAIAVQYKPELLVNQQAVQTVFISILKGRANNNLQNYQARANVSVLTGQLGSNSQNYQARAFVNILKGQLGSNSQNYQARAFVNILKGQLGSNSQNVSAYSPLISLTTAPVVSAINPTSLAKGSNNNLTIIGSNLLGTTTLVFLNDSTGVIDTSISVSNLVVAGDGNSLTATINVASNSVTGNRVVVISGATTGHSITSNVTSNIISITP